MEQQSAIKNQGTGTSSSVLQQSDFKQLFGSGKNGAESWEKADLSGKTASDSSTRNSCAASKFDVKKTDPSKVESGKEESKPFILITALSRIGGVFKKIDPISINFTRIDVIQRLWK